MKVSKRRSCQWATAGEALSDVRDPLEYGWEGNNGDYIPATTANAFAPSFLVNLISCNCKKYCKISCSCQSIGQNCRVMCECNEFCQNIDTALPRTALEENLQLQEELYSVY